MRERRVLGRAVLSVLALVGVVGVVPAAAGAAPTISVAPTAMATCTNAAYTLHWDLTNTSSDPVTITSAQQSGAVSGAVTFSPLTLGPAGGGAAHASATFGPVDGHTTGTVTLTVGLQSGATTGQQTAQIPLGGWCAEQNAAVPVAQVSPTTVAAGGTITVSGASCPFDPTWPAPSPYRVFVTLWATGPVAGQIVLPTDGYGTGTAKAMVGYAPAAGPGNVTALVTPAAGGSWTATLQLSSAATPIGAGTYGVRAVCYQGSDPDGRVEYQTAAVTVQAAATPPPAVTPSFTG